MKLTRSVSSNILGMSGGARVFIYPTYALFWTESRAGVPIAVSRAGVRSEQAIPELAPNRVAVQNARKRAVA